MIREVHGVVGERVEAAYAGSERILRIIDCENGVNVQCGSDCCLLTADEARCFGKQLLAAAIRFEKKGKK